jgi:malonyl-CoA O-methyltransferase
MSPSEPAPLDAREAYRLWASTYDTENPVSVLDQIAVDQLTPDVSQQILLDAGCGTGRRLPSTGAAAPNLAIGIDIVPEMLRAGRKREGESQILAAGDIEALPVSDGICDTAWCRLVMGHLQSIAQSYREFARVCRRQATLVVTDFHPAAAAVGYVRGFHDADGNGHIVRHHVHQVDDHKEAAAAAGFRLDARLDMTVGKAVAPAYELSGKRGEYGDQLGVPLVLALRFVR